MITIAVIQACQPCQPNVCSKAKYLSNACSKAKGNNVCQTLTYKNIKCACGEWHTEVNYKNYYNSQLQLQISCWEGTQQLLSLQSTQKVWEVQAHPLPPPGEVWGSNRTRSTQMVGEAGAHPPPPPGQALGSNRTCTSVNKWLG